jgi:predicted TIM-barrel fold metal-dependent hydrolase
MCWILLSLGSLATAPAAQDGQPEHLVAEAAHRAPCARERLPHLFGVDRCMFGSNYPLDSLCTSYQSIFEALASYVADFSAQGRAKLFVENARRIYRIAA